jgi:signal transduction histidine kinase
MGTLLATRPPLRVLLVEDSEWDGILLERALQGGGRETVVERVESPASFESALDRGTWDVVVADQALPTFGARAALATVKARGLDLPFIIVSGSIAEETAVEAMKAGAHDYMLKGNLARLAPAVDREVREAALRAERRAMQEQLRIAERMASVGTTTAAVAHEINNPLAVVLAGLEEIGREHARLAGAGVALGTADEALQDVREAAERLRDIVRDLKLFSGPEDERTTCVDVRVVLDSSCRLAWNDIRHRAKLVKDYADVPQVECNASRLGQVFLNLLVNAAQAIPAGRSGSNEIRLKVAPGGDGGVVVEVRDTGVGIPPEVGGRIFDAFFTTKPAEGGTGLGLAICQRLIQAAGGSLSVESEVGRGSVFRVWLPSIERDARPAPTAPAAVAVAAAVAAARRGSILVVDDEEAMLRVVRRVLQADHDVATTTSATEALARVAGGERFDVVLCDLMMPQMTGMDLHVEMMTCAPEQAGRMVFLTGGAFTPEARAFLERVSNPQIQKPFETAVLRSFVRGLVDAHPPLAS